LGGVGDAPAGEKLPVEVRSGSPSWPKFGRTTQRSQYKSERPNFRILEKLFKLRPNFFTDMFNNAYFVFSLHTLLNGKILLAGSAVRNNKFLRIIFAKPAEKSWEELATHPQVKNYLWR
jgi:hypothetical protein